MSCSVKNETELKFFQLSIFTASVRVSNKYIHTFYAAAIPYYVMKRKAWSETNKSAPEIKSFLIV